MLKKQSVRSENTSSLSLRFLHGVMFSLEVFVNIFEVLKNSVKAIQTAID